MDRPKMMDRPAMPGETLDRDTLLRLYRTTIDECEAAIARAQTAECERDEARAALVRLRDAAVAYLEIEGGPGDFEARAGLCSCITTTTDTVLCATEKTPGADHLSSDG